MPQAGKTFRIFVSSTFSDMKEERNALQERVFPKLRELCMQHGCRFQAIDLRWGVSEEAALDQQTMNICLNEINRCQKATPRPNFIVLLGKRYGWCPLPAQIETAEFEEILSKIKPDDKKLLIRGWYKKDDNAIPAEYCLQPRKVEYPNNATDDEKKRKREEESDKWNKDIESELRGVLIDAINKLGWPKDDPRRIKYEASATHQEIIYGALDSKDARDHVFCYFRNIVNSHPDDEAKDFIDSDNRSKEKLEELKCELRRKLPAMHIDDKYNATWNNGSLSTDHIDKLCEKVEEDLSRIILEEIAKIEKKSDLEQETENHWEFTKERAKNFVGRTDVLDRIRNYVTSEEKTPLIIHGKSGCGKTAIMAKMALELREKDDATVICRFIGATPESSVMRSLLTGICQGIYDAFGFEQEKQRKLNAVQRKFPQINGLRTHPRTACFKGFYAFDATAF